MSTPEQPATPALTRKQIRELRNTGSTPIIASVPDAAAPSADPATAQPDRPAPVVPAAVVPAAVTPAPFPRPAEPVDLPPAPIADSAVDLGVSPLTRRQARQQERIRTASVPVITPEVVAAHAATQSTPPTFAFAPAPVVSAPVAAPQPVVTEEPRESLFASPAPDQGADVSTDSGVHALFGVQRVVDEPAEAPARAAAEAPAAAETTQRTLAPAFEALPASIADPHAGFDDVLTAPDRPLIEEVAPADAKAVVNPQFGAGLLSVEPAGPVAEPADDLAPSFDQLLSRSTGAIPLPNTLIVSQAPEVSPLVAPLTATGEVLVTGSFQLPEGLGSTGHAKGTADGKEIDATLVDGELPSHSSPTPIAASAAVSTVKMPGEVIKPPVPEKSSKLMMSLAITAGVLGLALVGVLILAFVTGAL